MRRSGLPAVALATLLPAAALLSTASVTEPGGSSRPAAFGFTTEALATVSKAIVREAPHQWPGNRRFEFHFTRAVYSSGYGGGFGRGRGGFGSWATDYPKADLQFLATLRRLARELDAYEGDNAVRLDDPNLRLFPFVYAVEVGRMGLSDPEIKALREYLFAGGFLFVDDFWGTDQWQQFAWNITKVLPEYQIVDLPLDHPLFHTYYDITKIEQVPNIDNGCRGGPYYEQNGYEPFVKAIFDEHGRLLVLITWNSDLGDAWEWMEQACYPLAMATYAYQFAVNAITYAMSH